MTTPSVSADITVQTPLPDGIGEPFIEQVLSAAGDYLDVAGEVSVTFVDDVTIHAMNREYRNVDRPTDVLSFSQLEGEDDFPYPDGVAQLFGDIVISVPTAVRQADEYGHSVKRELAFLLVHGFLHLNGYDHDNETAEREMFGIQETVLGTLGLSRSDERA